MKERLDDIKGNISSGKLVTKLKENELGLDIFEFIKKQDDRRQQELQIKQQKENDDKKKKLTNLKEIVKKQPDPSKMKVNQLPTYLSSLKKKGGEDKNISITRLK